MADPQTADPLAPYSDTIDAAAHEWGQDPTMLRALILQESGGRPGAVSSAGARGLGQIIPKTATGLGITDPSDPAQQIFGAAKYLAEGFAKEKTPEGALLYYHGGPDYRKHYGPESDAYVPGVAAHYTRLSKGAGNDNAAAVPSDEEFLKQAAPAPAAVVPSDEEFLKSTGAAPGQPDKAAPAAKPDPVYDSEGHPVDDHETPLDVLKRDVAAVAPAASRIGQAAAEGWGDKNPLMTPELQAIIEAGGPVGRYITSPLLQAGGGVLRGGNALAAGTSAAIGEGGNTILPGLGRDLNMLAQVAPVAHIGTGMPRPPGVPENPLAGPVQRGVDQIEAPLSPEFKASPLAPGAAERIAPPAGPRAAGAEATPPPLAEMSMAEYKANRKQGELNAIMEPAKAGEDNTTYVPGSVPTLAERTADPATSQQERLLRERDPNAFAPQLQKASEARVNLLQQEAGSAPDIVRINRNIEDLAKAEKPRVLNGAKDLNLGGAADVANSIMNDPELAEQKAVQKVIAPLREQLYDADGNLKTDPRAGWGIINNIRNLVDDAKLDSSQERHVVSLLLRVRDALADAMNVSTDGRFSEYNAKLTRLFQERNSKEVLQAKVPQLVNAKGDIYFNRFHTWLLGLARERGAPGAEASMAISDATMQKLIAIDKDLKRSLNIDLGTGRGSPTNLMFALSQQMGLGLVHAAVHGGVAAMGGGGVGNLAAQSVLSGAGARINALNLSRKVKKHLAPPPPGENWLAGH